jgi:hypothetical protein
MSCCRVREVGADKKLYEQLEAAAKALEERGTDVLIADTSIATKKQVLRRLVAQAERIARLLEKT